jgi:hypothetical protein
MSDQGFRLSLRTIQWILTRIPTQYRYHQIQFRSHVSLFASPYLIAVNLNQSPIHNRTNQPDC